MPSVCTAGAPARTGDGQAGRQGPGRTYALDEVFGAFIRGFDHESSMSPYGDEGDGTWPGLVEAVPEEFAA
ncbi:hypothetical protein amrb99_12990 [Actinomadura sp. RB99]|nr:hypothetical protein [Actinomadura sp. RB99]